MKQAGGELGLDLWAQKLEDTYGPKRSGLEMIMPASEYREIDLAAELGAEGATSVQVLTLYIPSKDREGNDLENQKDWVMRASRILARIGGGVTVFPPCEGGWLDPESDAMVWESPVLAYTYVRTDQFIENLESLREFLHRLGRETRQGEVAFEFDGSFFRIVDFDSCA